MNKEPINTEQAELDADCLAMFTDILSQVNGMDGFYGVAMATWDMLNEYKKAFDEFTRIGTNQGLDERNAFLAARQMSGAFLKVHFFPQILAQLKQRTN